MAPYALARMVPPPGKPLISLAQNESLRAPSPAVLAALQDVDLAAYPDPDWTHLRATIASSTTSTRNTILFGAGSLDLIGCLARVYAGPDRAVLMPAHAYPFFGSAAQMADARFDTAPEDHLTVCVDALLDRHPPGYRHRVPRKSGQSHRHPHSRIRDTPPARGPSHRHPS
jgi:histidinol-phosphate aminotransferase